MEACDLDNPVKLRTYCYVEVYCAVLVYKEIIVHIHGNSYSYLALLIVDLKLCYVLHTQNDLCIIFLWCFW